MPMTLRQREILFLAFAFFSGVILYPTFVKAESIWLSFLVIPSLILAVFIPFIVFLMSSQPQVEKGIALILLGAGIKIIYLPWIEEFAPPPNVHIFNFKVLGEFILVACTGAGGSILGSFGDSFSSTKRDSKGKHSCEVSRIEFESFKSESRKVSAIVVILLVLILVSIWFN